MNPEDFSSESILASGQARTVEVHPELGSTQDRARELASEHSVKLPALVVAERQTAGRGRGDHRWHSGDGSLTFSLLLDEARLNLEPRDSPRISLAVAVALVRVVQPMLPQHRVGLHWPNDVFVDDRKLAGILIERLASGILLIGVGMNVNNRAADAPPELRSELASLADLLAEDCNRGEVLIALLASINHQLHHLNHDATGLAFDELCQQRGRELTVQTGAEAIAGTCLGITTDGGLRLNTPAGERTIYSGSLVH